MRPAAGGWIAEQLEFARLVEVCEQTGVPAYLVDDQQEVNPAWLEGVKTVAVTAGASAPEAPGSGVDRIPADRSASMRWKKWR